MIGDKLKEYFQNLMFTEPMGLLWVTIADLGALIERDGMKIEDDWLSERYIRCLISPKSPYVKYTKTLEKDIRPPIIEECERTLLDNNDKAVKGYIKEVARQVNKLERALSELKEYDMERLRVLVLDRNNPKHSIYEAVLLYLSVCRMELKYIDELFTTKIRDYELGNFNDYKQREQEYLEPNNTHTPQASKPLKQLCYPLKKAHKRVANASAKEHRKKQTEVFINKILEMESERVRPQAEAKPESKEPQLPKELDTPEAKEIFAKAVEVGLMEVQGNRCKWNKSKALLAYFADKMSERLNLGKGIYDGKKKISWKPFENMLDIKGLSGAKRDYQRDGTLPDGSNIVDTLF